MDFEKHRELHLARNGNSQKALEGISDGIPLLPSISDVGGSFLSMPNGRATLQYKLLLYLEMYE